MKNKIMVSASILCADFKRLGDEIKRCEDAGVDMIHVDVMDGHFVPVISIGEVIVESIRPLTKLPIETHLMVDNPSKHIERYIACGADIISIHAECYGTLKIGCREEGSFPKESETFDSKKAMIDIAKIKKNGKNAVIVVNPGTPILFDSILNEIDGVLIMSVNPGFAKQKFMPVALPKIKELRANFDGDIAIDGGINALTAPEAVKAGANILATASFFFGSDDQKKAVNFLKGLK